MPRTEIALMKGWRFALDAVGGRPDDSDFKPVCLPHDWAVLAPADEHAALGGSQGFFNRSAVGWYRRALRIGEIPAGSRCWLEFGGVSENCTLWVNGVEIGGQRYGYTPFRLDVTDALRPGENELLLRVDCTAEPADRWYSGCGIYRTVKLCILPEDCLDSRQIAVTTGADGFVRIRTGREDEVQAALLDAEGRTVASGTGREEIALRVASPCLWTAETPYLYTLRLSTASDEISLRIGLRESCLRPDGLYINGRRTILKGVCLHQDFACRGVAVKAELWRARLRQLKEIGCNALRLAHHVFAEEFLDLCDEMGFYVYEEAFDKWHSGLYGRYFDEDWRHDLDAMVLRDRNRPSVLLWGVGNEVENQAHAGMIDTLKTLVARVRELDSTRPVTYAMNPHFKRPAKVDLRAVKDIQAFVDEIDDREIYELNERLDCVSRIAEYVDLIAGNYQEPWYDDIHARLPEKPILGTEVFQYFMGHPDCILHFTEHLPSRMPLEKAFVIGSFVWTGFDYLGESMGWPSKGWTGSVFRTDGNPRFSAAILQSLWTEAPMVRFALMDYTLPDEFCKEHWSLPPYVEHWHMGGVHQCAVPFAVATNCDRIEIALNGRRYFHSGCKDSPKGIITGFLPYVPGEICIEGYIGGKRVCSQTLRTPGQASQIVFCPAETTLPREEGYEVFLPVQARDERGTPNLRTCGRVAFTVDGPAEIIAVDNGNLMEQTPYPSKEIPLYLGRAGVLLRLTGEPGTVRVTARAERMQAGVTELHIH